MSLNSQLRYNKGKAKKLEENMRREEEGEDSRESKNNKSGEERPTGQAIGETKKRHHHRLAQKVGSESVDSETRLLPFPQPQRQTSCGWTGPKNGFPTWAAYPGSCRMSAS